MRLFNSYRPVTLAAAAALAIVALPQMAQAQAAPKVTFAPAVAQSSGASQTAQTTPASMAPYWELIGGVEGDTDGMMYAFFGPSWTRPLNDTTRLQLTARGNFLKYEFEENGGVTEVSGPGISTQVGLKFGDRHTFKIGAGPSFKWRNEKFTAANGTETEFDGDMEVGISVGADASLNPTRRDNVHALVNYNTEDKYMWSRLGYKHQISNYNWQETFAHFIGAEGILQGNDDIRTMMLGGLFEFVHAPSSTALMVRGGYKKSTFDVEDDRTGPYVGVNFYKRLGR
ncbi:MAG: cellulose biosynthesis protein BcsS [Acidobacteriota bacterium]|nr:cellulose biosynthesis protein BcsS [Acidobacteriota bacterium]